jgi:hypothetical protein
MYSDLFAWNLTIVDLRISRHLEPINQTMPVEESVDQATSSTKSKHKLVLSFFKQIYSKIFRAIKKAH